MRYEIAVRQESKYGFVRSVIRINDQFVATFPSPQKAESEKDAIVKRFKSLPSAAAKAAYIAELLVKNSMYE